MYSKNGSFGQVRLATNPQRENKLFSFSVCGWHKCNDLYRIERSSNAAALFFYTVSGCGEMYVDGEKLQLTEGTIGYIPANMSGRYYTPKNGIWEFYWIHPTGESVNLLLQHLPRPCVARTNHLNDLTSLIEETMTNVSLQEHPIPWSISSSISSLLHLSALDLSEEFRKQPTLSERTVQYFNAHLKDQINVRSAADALYVSPAHLIRVFKKEQGLTPHAYLLQRRLQCAKELLLLQMPVNETARALGFCSASHFISAFRKTYGITPTQFQGK